MLWQEGKLEPFSISFMKAVEVLANAKESGDISAIKRKTNTMEHG